MGTDQVNAPQYVAPTNQLYADVETLTPEAAMIYCSSRLETLDTMIRGRFEEQKKSSKAIADLGRLNSVMNNASEINKGANNGTDHTKDHINQGNAIIEIYNSTDDPKVKELCLEKYEMWTGMPMPAPNSEGKVPPGSAALDTTKIEGIPPEQYRSQNSNIKEAQDALSKENELNMIQLQSTISQRQLAIQMTTQIMQAIAEGKKTICGNIRA